MKGTCGKSRWISRSKATTCLSLLFLYALWAWRGDDMKEFFATIAGVMLGAFLFVLILGGPAQTVSLKSQTGNVMKDVVTQMHKISP